MIWMVIPAIVPVSAVSLLEELTYCESVRILKEEIEYLIVIFHLLKFSLCDAIENLLLMSEPISCDCQPSIVQLSKRILSMDYVINVIDLRVIIERKTIIRHHHCSWVHLRG